MRQGEDRRHHAAGAAPWRPAVDEDRAGGGEHLPVESAVRHLDGTALIARDDQNGAALAAEGLFVEPVLRHAVFCAAAQTTDDHLVQRDAAFAAEGPVVEPFLRDAVFRAAVEAADHHLFFFHMATQCR